MPPTVSVQYAVAARRKMHPLLQYFPLLINYFAKELSPSRPKPCTVHVTRRRMMRAQTNCDRVRARRRRETHMRVRKKSSVVPVEEARRLPVFWGTYAFSCLHTPLLGVGRRRTIREKKFNRTPGSQNGKERDGVDNAYLISRWAVAETSSSCAPTARQTVVKTNFL